MKSIIRSKNGTLVLTGACFLLLAIISLLPLLENSLYSYVKVFFAVVKVIITVGAELFTIFVFGKQIRLNAFFGITRGETTTKWAIKIGIVSLMIIVIAGLLAVVNAVIIDNYDIINILTETCLSLRGFNLFIAFNVIIVIMEIDNAKKITKVITIVASVALSILEMIFVKQIYLSLLLVLGVIGLFIVPDLAKRGEY